MNRIAIDSLGQRFSLRTQGWGSLPHAVMREFPVLPTVGSDVAALFPNFGLKPKFRIYKACKFTQISDFYRLLGALAYGTVIA